MPADQAPPKSDVPTTVWALGLTSLLMDISTNMVNGLLGVYMVTVMHTSVGAFGLVTGLGDATAQIFKGVSGRWADRARSRKLLTLIGYGLSAINKPAFALASSPFMLLGANVTDRLGKGIRSAPRDALIADVVDPHNRGAAFGLRQSMDTVGAVLGPVAGTALMAYTGGHYRTVFALATLPALASVTVLALFVREPDRAERAEEAQSTAWSDVQALPSAFWGVVALGVVFAMARLGEGFLLLRAESVGVTAGHVPLLLAAMNVVYAATAWPVGRLSDKGLNRVLRVAGLAVLVAADLTLAFAGGFWTVLLGCLLWGLQMGLTQGVLVAWVAEIVPSERRGTAFGAFAMASGLSALLASALAGAAWDAFGPAVVFSVGAAGAMLALGSVTLKDRRLAA
jgi:MFS family permease